MTTLKESLKNKLTEKQLTLVPSSYDMVGDLAIFSDFPKELKNKEKMIGNALLNLNKNIKVVLKNYLYCTTAKTKNQRGPPVDSSAVS